MTNHLFDPSPAVPLIPEDAESVKRRKKVQAALILFVLVLFSILAYTLGMPLVRKARESPEAFREMLQSHGVLGALIMIGLTMLQVIIAFIPGEPFELGAGYAFGWLEGTALCLAGAALASAIVFLTVRKWGVGVVELFFSREKIMRYSFLRNRKKLNLLVFILFLVPGTPKDLLTYIVGLTPMKLSSFLMITMLARIPSVVSSAITGSLTQEGNYLAAVITYGVTLVITLICVLYYRKLTQQEKREEQAP